MQAGRIASSTSIQPESGKLTNIFQRGSNHQPVTVTFAMEDHRTKWVMASVAMDNYQRVGFEDDLESGDGWKLPFPRLHVSFVRFERHTFG